MDQDNRASRRAFLKGAGLLAASAFAVGMPSRALAADSNGPLKIGVIGSGREGSSLGTLFVKSGHPVLFSSRHPESLQSLVNGLGQLAKAGTVDEAVAFGDVVLIVVPYAAMPEIGKAYGAALAQKQMVMDVSNPNPRRDGEEIVNTVNGEGGAGLATAKFLQGARVVRAFNAIGSTQLAGLAHRAGDPVGVPIAGDDPQAVAIAERLIREIGFEPVLVGGLAAGRHLVPGASPLAGVHTPAEIRQIASTLH